MTYPLPFSIPSVSGVLSHLTEISVQPVTSAVFQESILYCLSFVTLSLFTAMRHACPDC